ncbi:AraC family transcriptional regulator [Pontibacter sp. G13]|uniref:helix-turn-helix domain-containing protein n=1 Tax=Pontibacter sp. G13 TaxID=3074898 RepID=UPI00288ACBFF|nr:AraC family transcriptional regulator [Pontibacter sp. G13]WNJ18271.1 AraC family transcriptional regulator [Pontibacter sp. G13]
MQGITIRNIPEPLPSGNFQIVDLAERLLDKKMEEGLHRHDFYFMLVLEEAGGKHHIDFEEYPLSPQSISLIRPGQVHELVLELGGKGYLLSFDATFYGPSDSLKQALFWKVFQQNFFQLDRHRFDLFQALVRRVFDEFTHQKVGYEEVIKATLSVLLIELMRVLPSENSLAHMDLSSDQAILDKFIQMIDSHACMNRTVSEYSQDLHITSYKLNTVTKSLVGKTSSQLIMDRMILEAKRLLLATTLQVNEIAYELCYEDPAYFVRLFKKQTGYTPQVFRQTFR